MFRLDDERVPGAFERAVGRPIRAAQSPLPAASERSSTRPARPTSCSGSRRAAGSSRPAFLATQAPIFTLYGDGTIVFRNPMKEGPPPVGDVFRFSPFRTARLSEDQIQATLERAIGEGGLGTARPNYENNMVADASTTIFTIDAGGLKKTVSVYALGMDDPTSSGCPRSGGLPEAGGRAR